MGQEYEALQAYGSDAGKEYIRNTLAHTQRYITGDRQIEITLHGVYGFCKLHKRHNTKPELGNGGSSIKLGVRTIIDVMGAGRI